MWWLILLGIFGRIWRFGQVPLSLYWDEVAIGLDSRSLLQTGHDLSNHPWLQALFYSYGDYKAPVYIWLTTVLGRFFSVSELVIRLPSLLAGLATGWFLFQIIKLVSSPKSKLPVYVLVSYLIMPWSIHFSRIGFESHLSLFWLILAVYLLIRAGKKNQPWNIVLSAVAVSAGIYTYISLRVLAPILFIIAFGLYFFSKLKSSFLYFLVGLVIILSSINFLVRSPGYAASQQYRLSNDNLINSTIYITKPAKLRQFLLNYSQYFSARFLGLSGDPNLRHHSGFGGELLLTQLFLVVIGLLTVLPKRKPENLLLFSWLGLGPTIAALVNETPHASRSIYLIIPLAWLAGLGWQWLAQKKRLKTIIILALTLNLLVYLHDYFSHYPQRSALAWINPYKQVALSFKEQLPEQPVYITPALYKPELYWAYYLNDLQLLQPNNRFYYYLPQVCPEGALCVDSF